MISRDHIKQKAIEKYGIHVAVNTFMKKDCTTVSKHVIYIPDKLPLVIDATREEEWLYLPEIEDIENAKKTSTPNFNVF